jgi:hypothetical protein
MEAYRVRRLAKSNGVNGRRRFEGRAVMSGFYYSFFYPIEDLTAAEREWAQTFFDSHVVNFHHHFTLAKATMKPALAIMHHSVQGDFISCDPEETPVEGGDETDDHASGAIDFLEAFVREFPYRGTIFFYWIECETGWKPDADSSIAIISPKGTMVLATDRLCEAIEYAGAGETILHAAQVKRQESEAKKK